MPRGVFRRVLLIGPWAVKLPRWRNFSKGLRCNRWEREMWQVWQPHFNWTYLCPVLLADPAGLIVVMPRASQPVSDNEAEAAADDAHPSVNCESKAADHGRLGDRVVALDYGLPDEDMVLERRQYYGTFLHDA
jgi:hypothetical protein